VTSDKLWQRLRKWRDDLRVVRYSVFTFFAMEVRSVEAIIRALNDANVRYLIVGGLAVNAHGFVRLTRDVDIVLALDPENATRGLDALLKSGYKMAIPAQPEEFADAETREDWRQNKGMIVLKLWSDEHRRTPVDIFVYEPFDFAEEFKIATSHEVCSGVLAKVVSFETLLKMKRDAGRPQDLIDIDELQRAR
jgi:hypothetical protein